MSKFRNKLLSIMSAAIIGSAILSCDIPVKAQEVGMILDNRETTYDWYLEFQEAISLLPEEYRPCPITNYFTDNDLTLFYRVVTAEIGSNQYTFAQKVNVASVIIHRWINDGSRGLGTVLTPSQFSTVKSGRIYKVSVTNEIKAACQYAMWFDGDYSGAIFFNNARTWDGIYKYLGYDGAHYYYR